MLVMSKPKKTAGKPTGGKHKTERKPMQVPVDWLRVIRRRASKGEKPALWYVISLVRAECIAAGETDLPPLPWEETETA
jgi:hypothetical protein